MPAHRYGPPVATRPPSRVTSTHTSAPSRDLDVVDPAARSYRVVSLYGYLRADSRAHDPDPNDLRIAFEDRNPAAVRREIAELVADRRRLRDDLHAGRPVVIPRWRIDGHIWAAEVDHVPWLADRSVDWLEVTVDDVVTPAARPLRSP